MYQHNKMVKNTKQGHRERLESLKAGQMKMSVIATGPGYCRHHFCISETTELATMLLSIILEKNATSVAHTSSNILTCYFCVTTVGPLKQQAKTQASENSPKRSTERHHSSVTTTSRFIFCCNVHA